MMPVVTTKTEAVAAAAAMVDGGCEDSICNEMIAFHLFHMAGNWWQMACHWTRVNNTYTGI